MQESHGQAYITREVRTLQTGLALLINAFRCAVFEPHQTKAFKAALCGIEITPNSLRSVEGFAVALDDHNVPCEIVTPQGSITLPALDPKQISITHFAEMVGLQEVPMKDRVLYAVRNVGDTALTNTIMPVDLRADPFAAWSGVFD